jgi:oligopeptidase B
MSGLLGPGLRFAGMTTAPNPSLAAICGPVERSHHGYPVVDSYSWLADAEHPDTVAYLEADNTYTEQRTAHLAELREQIFIEIKSCSQETDLSMLWRKGGW